MGFQVNVFKANGYPAETIDDILRDYSSELEATKNPNRLELKKVITGNPVLWLAAPYRPENRGSIDDLHPLRIQRFYDGNGIVISKGHDEFALEIFSRYGTDFSLGYHEIESLEDFSRPGDILIPEDTPFRISVFPDRSGSVSIDEVIEKYARSSNTGFIGGRPNSPHLYRGRGSKVFKT